MNCRAQAQVPITLHPAPKPEPYIDAEGFSDLVCRNEVDRGSFGDDQPRPGPCKCNLFIIQGNDDGRLRVRCSECGHEATLHVVEEAQP